MSWILLQICGRPPKGLIITAAISHLVQSRGQMDFEEKSGKPKEIKIRRKMSEFV